MAQVKGGERLKLALLDIALQVEGGGLIRVGFLEGATYPQKPREALRSAYNARRRKGNLRPMRGSKAQGALTVPMVAFWNEYGTKNAPPRPFFRTMIRKKLHEWGPALAIQLRLNNYDVPKSLAILGEGIAGQLRQSIIDTNAPPLRPSTIARKGFSKPLIDTAHMIMSVDYQVL